LAKDCYTIKLDLLTKVTVIDDAIRFVTENQQQAVVKSKANDVVIEDGRKESEENFDIQRSKEENKHQQPAGDSTTNQTF
jgi:hypothetical protein